MYKINNYYNHDTLFCIICRKIMYMSNYNQHLNSKIHNYNKNNRKIKKIDQKYIISFD